jgi:hypothetical protein
MEDQLVQLLSATQTAQEGPRKQAEEQLKGLYGHQDFPIALVQIARHAEVPINIRQASLLYLKQLVLAGWSDSMDEFKGQLLVSEENKPRIRQMLLEFVTTEEVDRKLKAAASLVVSKIASSDYPDQWPDLLSVLLNLIPTATDGQLHGALKVLGELVDDCFNEAQFFGVAKPLINVLHGIAINEARRPQLRALACSVFRDCFDILEMVMEDHKAEIKRFADEVLQEWNPFFIAIMKTRLPDPPSEAEENEDTPNAETYRGLVALKLQVVKVCIFAMTRPTRHQLTTFRSLCASGTYSLACYRPRAPFYSALPGRSCRLCNQHTIRCTSTRSATADSKTPTDCHILSTSWFSKSLTSCKPVFVRLQYVPNLRSSCRLLARMRLGFSRL